MYRIDPNDIQIHFELPPQYAKSDVVAIDSEFFNQEKEKLHRPHGDFGCVGCTNNGTDVYMIFNDWEVGDFYKRINNAAHVYHNAQYDIRQLRVFSDEIRDRKKIWDTMLIEQIRFSGYYDSFALNDLARRYLNIYMDKSERETFTSSDSHRMSDEQILYAAIDIVCTWMIAQEQMSQIDEDDLSIWKHIEMPFLWTLLDTKGIKLDVEKWTTRYENDERLVKELNEKLPFNPRSPKQVKEYFLEKYKIKLSGTSEGVLVEVAEKYPEIPELRDILTARGLSKAAGTYGKKWVDNLENGMIYPSWRQIGATTGRMSAGGNYAIQTVPHAVEYRDCFIAEDDEVLAINDYSSQEPKLLAAVTGDPTLQRIFQEKKDVYIEVGYEVFGERFDKKDDRRRQMKSIILGVSYGMSAKGLAVKLNISEDYAQELLNRFFEKFPLVKIYIDECHKWKPYTTTILGRKFWGNPYDNGWKRNYQNFPMQGSAVDCTKIAASKLRKQLGYNPCRIYMHDELVCSFNKIALEHGSALMTKIMIETQNWMHPDIPGGCEQGIGNSWNSKP